MTMLDACVRRISSLSAADRQCMFELYRDNYGGAAAPIFNKDLDAKDYSILLTDPLADIRGFSTLAVYSERYRGKPVKVIYSGDTIIDRAYWGKNEFAATWLRLVGSIKADAPGIPLYWLLIVKGHRTYRYLSLFSNEYYPRHDAETPPERQRLMHHLAKSRFGDSYDPDSGLVRFQGQRSFLKEDLAPVPPKDMARGDVQYFLARNPGYAQGDELLCLCELTPENLTRFARAWFMEGMKRAA
ncbi:MAG: hypothetical protein EPN97_03960 [Alphaproteobacteria bacterium]|nr:MAG: hypothetical protein EPN97_03960 [Alphaproteobacteria bacterium]